MVRLDTNIVEHSVANNKKRDRNGTIVTKIEQLDTKTDNDYVE